MRKGVKTIYKTAKPSTKYYYLCADYHSYQDGNVYIPIDDTTEMNIKQYIVGTGGTKLDEPLVNNTPMTYEYEQGQKYKFIKNIQDWGFLVCRDTRDKLSCEFISISEPIESMQFETQTQTMKSKKKTAKKSRTKKMKSRRKW